MQAALPIANWAVDCPDELVLRPDEILTGIFLPLTFSASCTPMYFFYFDLS